ncbi:unnamed protein product [Rotaria sordida]|uniref:Reverse transcriptase domain-containing protein n=1 Tax=Rotaria sordida TaxID=392033 RepID=A0A815QAS8_9BILA|nr:unnamed protein product [Rotaria sordida]
MNLLQEKFHVNFTATNDNQNTKRKNDTTILNEQSIPKKMKLHEVAIDYQDDDEYLDNHPLPNMKQAIQLLGGGYKFFSKLDMKSGFCQILIKEEDKFKTAVITPDSFFEWNVLAQGLKNSPPSFQ